jgi:hypothetical protein
MRRFDEFGRQSDGVHLVGEVESGLASQHEFFQHLRFHQPQCLIDILSPTLDVGCVIAMAGLGQRCAERARRDNEASSRSEGARYIIAAQYGCVHHPLAENGTRHPKAARAKFRPSRLTIKGKPAKQPQIGPAGQQLAATRNDRTGGFAVPGLNATCLSHARQQLLIIAL